MVEVILFKLLKPQKLVLWVTGLVDMLVVWWRMMTAADGVNSLEPWSAGICSSCRTRGYSCTPWPDCCLY